MTLRDAGDLVAAIDSFKAVVALQAESPEAHNDLGAVLLMQGDINAAVDAFRRAIDLDPHCGMAYENYASAHVFRQADTEAVASMETLAADSSITDELRISLSFSLGKAHADRGAFDTAFAHYKRANKLKRRTLEFDADWHRDTVSRTIACFGRELFMQKRGLGAESERPVFILGMPRAGTTLVEQILASHPGVEGTHELPDLGRVARSIGLKRDDKKVYPGVVPELSD